MADTIRLRGMTWNDPRGYDPMVATSAAFAQIRPSVEIVWDARSLQDFESFPVEELARTYDLMVIDHPHVGQIVAESCLLPLDDAIDPNVLAEMEAQSLGASFASYRYAGRLWALPIDASAQVLAFRPDALPTPPTRWDEVLALAAEGRIVWPLRAPHSLMGFFTLAANRGTPCGTASERLIGRDDGLAVLDALLRLAAHVEPACFGMDPIAALDRLAEDPRLVCAPLTYGYRNYAKPGYRANAVRFADIPALGDQGPRGSTLGGTGIAVSARSAHPAEAVAYAAWIASAEVQRTLYARAGGQPGNARAWEDNDVNAAHHGFYRDVRRTLDLAWVRPRHDGYMRFQAEASAIVAACLIGAVTPGTALDRLDAAWRASRPS